MYGVSDAAFDPAHAFPGATAWPSAKWGFPHASPRQVAPTILMVVHITRIHPDDPPLLAAVEEAATCADDEREVSFTFVNDRDGSTVQCLDPVWQAPWTNGRLASPNLTVASIADIVAGAANANERCFMTVENVGNEALGLPITEAQIRTLAAQAAWGSRLAGLPVDATTVLGHADFDTEAKRLCPTGGDLRALLARVVSLANERLVRPASGRA